MNTRLALLAAAALMAAPASATVLMIDSGWQGDTLSTADSTTDASPWTFSLASGGHFSLTDCCRAGDTYTLSGDINGVSVVGAGAADGRADGSVYGDAWLNASLGKFTTYLGAGDYTVTISGDGLGGIPAGLGVRLDSAVPEPATWAMMIAGFGLVGAAVRRRVAIAA